MAEDDRRRRTEDDRREQIMANSQQWTTTAENWTTVENGGPHWTTVEMMENSAQYVWTDDGGQGQTEEGGGWRRILDVGEHCRTRWYKDRGERTKADRHACTMADKVGRYKIMADEGKQVQRMTDKGRGQQMDEDGGGQKAVLS